MLSGTTIERMVKEYQATLSLNSTILLSNGSVPFDPILTDEIAKYRVEVTISLTFLVGLFQVHYFVKKIFSDIIKNKIYTRLFKLALGFSGLGFITSYFSDTFISSYTCASAIVVIKSQVKSLFGLENTIRYSGIYNIPKVTRFTYNFR